MSVLQGFKNFFVGEDDTEPDEYQPHYEQPAYDRKRDYNRDYAEPSYQSDNNSMGGNRSMTMEQTKTLQIVLARPNDFSEVKSIGDDLNAQKTVLLNLEMVKSDDAKRILDFLSGVAYANSADIKMMAQKTFAIMPKNVGFEGVDLMSELENNGYSF